jgi:hypothetical protein
MCSTAEALGATDMRAPPRGATHQWDELLQYHRGGSSMWRTEEVQRMHSFLH